MAGQGGCFKRRSPLANQAALVEAASARLASSEPRVVPCAAQTSEQYRYVSAAGARARYRRRRRRHCRCSVCTTLQSALRPARPAAGASCLSSPFPPPPPSFYLGYWERRSNSGVSTFQCFIPTAPQSRLGSFRGATLGYSPLGLRRGAQTP